MTTQIFDFGIFDAGIFDYHSASLVYGTANGNSAIITQGYVAGNPFIITQGYHGVVPWIARMIEALEKTSVGYTLIDYRYIEPGLAGSNITHNTVKALVNGNDGNINYIDHKFIRPGLTGSNFTENQLRKLKK